MYPFFKSRYSGGAQLLDVFQLCDVQLGDSSTQLIREVHQNSLFSKIGAQLISDNQKCKLSGS